MDTIIQRNDEELENLFRSLSNNDDIANLLEVSKGTLIYYVYRLNKRLQYKTYQVAKRNGSTRTISAPTSNIKILQQKFNYIFQLVYSPRECAFAYSMGRNVIQNARVHKQSRVLLKIDLKNFFEQIHFGRVRGFFMSEYPFGFGDKVATTLANICTFEGKLPQGAPTSPIISNMICWGLDRDLQRLCRKLKCKYTRYADDIIISTKQNELPLDIAINNNGVCTIGEKLTFYFEKHDFALNFDKVKMIRSNKRQLVTGLVTNEIVNVPRKYIHELRLQMRIWEKYGYKELSQCVPNRTHKNPKKRIKNYKWTIQGRLNYLKQVKVESVLEGRHYDIYLKLQRWFDYLILRDKFNSLKSSSAYQARGYALEDILNKLFVINGIKAKNPFRRRKGADQIDGAFVLEKNKHFLIECKWIKDTDKINKEIDAFAKKLDRSGDEISGLFISIAGWNENAVHNLKESKTKNILLLDGKDLEIVLTNRKVSLDDLFAWMLENLSFKAEPHIPVKEFLKTF